MVAEFREDQVVRRSPGLALRACCWGHVGSGVLGWPSPGSYLTPLTESLALSGFGLFDLRAQKALLACDLSSRPLWEELR